MQKYTIWPLVYLNVLILLVGHFGEMHGKWPVATCYFCTLVGNTCMGHRPQTLHPERWPRSPPGDVGGAAW